MNFLENYYYFLKKKKFIKFISNFIYLLPDYFVYQIFKNAIRNGQYSLCKKTYDLLNKRKINKNLSERFFISKIVFFEIQLYLKLKLIKLNHEKRILNFKNFLSEIKILKKKDFVKNYKFFISQKEMINKMLIEFIYCDSIFPNIKKYYKADLILNGINYKKKINLVSLDEWWFQSIGHMFLLDSLIKGILMNIINIKKITFNIKNNNIANKYIYNRYIKILKKNNLYLTNHKKKEKLNLNLRFWHIHKFKQSMESENIHEYIQKKWRISKKDKLFYFNAKEQNDYNNLVKKIGISKKIITIHIRQDGFHASNDNAKIRNSNLILFLETINEIKSDCLFVLMGGKHIKLKGKAFTNIFNYANSNLKSDKNDFLLINYCDAHIGTTSGPSHHMLTTNKPVLYINWYPFDFSTKNDLSIIMPKIVKKKTGEIFSPKNYFQIKPKIFYDGIERMENYDLYYEDNSQEDLLLATNKFVQSLKPNWKNYGIKYLIKSKNYDFHGIPSDLNNLVLNSRKRIYLEPNFVKKYKNYI